MSEQGVPICNQRIMGMLGVRCALPSGHRGECSTHYDGADRCMYQFEDPPLPAGMRRGVPVVTRPRCALPTGHLGGHRPDR